ncbi:MAG: alkaline phosphatase [Bacteroidales bacterium]|nr:alkaline phosphatase [Bacteroidales bacterium]MDT8372888.1 alkaline phosphatase [Bacteroidales bacterium]
MRIFTRTALLTLLAVILASAGGGRQSHRNLNIFKGSSMSITGGDTSRREVSAHFSIKGHSGVMVPVFAYGPGAMAFTGVQDNTELFHDFVRLLSLDKE